MLGLDEQEFFIDKNLQVFSIFEGFAYSLGDNLDMGDRQPILYYYNN